MPELRDIKIENLLQRNANRVSNSEQCERLWINLAALNFVERSTRKASLQINSVLTIALRATQLGNVFAKQFDEFLFFHPSIVLESQENSLPIGRYSLGSNRLGNQTKVPILHTLIGKIILAPEREE